MQLSEILTPKEIIYSKRKTLSLLIDSKGDFLVRAPLRYPMYKIREFIISKADWIISKKTKIKESIKYPPLIFKSGEKIPLFDEECMLELSNTTRVKKISNNLIIPSQNSKNYLIKYLKRELKKYIMNKIDNVAHQMKVEYRCISISSARTNWGSCSGDDKVHFSFYLAFCPSYVIDYIIVHELSHIIVKNHSDKFWNTVSTFYPEYKTSENWLKNNRYIMNII